VLPKSNRLRVGSDFNRITKTGVRINSENLVIYAALAGSDQPQIGFIVNRSVGGSVTRHLVTRKLRHNLASHIKDLPKKSMLVVRVLKQQNDYTTEVAASIEKTIAKLSSKKADAWEKYLFLQLKAIKNLSHLTLHPAVSTTHPVLPTPNLRSLSLVSKDYLWLVGD